MADDDVDARRKRAEELRRAIDDAAGPRERRAPTTPREFTDQKAREAAEEAHRRADAEDEPDEDS